MSLINLENAAQVLVDAVFMTDAEAAKKNNLSRQTVLGYRRRLNPEHKTFTPELVQIFTIKLKEAREVEGWADKLTEPIRKAVSFICQACDELNPKNPESLKAVTGALQVLVAADLARKVIDERISPTDHLAASHTHRKGAGQVFATPQGEA